MKRAWTVVLGILLFLSSTAVAQLPADIPREKTVIVATVTGRVGSPDNFNEWVGWKWRDRGMQQLMNESLWTADAATGKIVNGLAKEGPLYNDSFTELTIKLREGCYWSDGVPITADDLVYTIEIHQKVPELNYHAAIAEEVESVRKVDDHTVVITLKKPNPRFHRYFLDDWGALWVMPKHVFEKVENLATFTFNPPVSSGPYVLYDYDPAGYWTIWKKREDWSRTPTGMLFGEPKPEYVVFQHFDTEEAKILAMLRNELDSAIFSPQGFRAVLEKSPTARPWRKEWPWVAPTDPAPTGIIFNTMQPPFQNRNVRWALTLAIDIVEFMTIASDLMAVPIPIHVPPTPLYREIFLNPMENWLREFALDLGDGEKFAPFDPDVPRKLAEAARKAGHPVPDNPDMLRELFGIGWWKYAPEVAEKLLLREGFRRDDKGKWLLPDGSPWKLEITTSPALEGYGPRNALAVAEQWKKFGIDVTVLYSEDVVNLVNHGQFQVSAGVVAHEQEGVTPDFYETFDCFNSARVRPIGEFMSLNPSRWSDPRIDDLINRFRLVRPDDWETMQNLSIEGLKILVEEMPTVPTFGNVVYQVWDEYFFKGWPGAENTYCQISADWPNFKYMLPFLQLAKES
uniref:ABC transporter substrate-binding protein n=1 Tax=Candidatus Caldatribacterium saccharofermentans TaxID=1454753 RepID=A0A7V4WKC5_9BACT